MNINTIGSLTKEQEDLHYISGWPSKTDNIPIYRTDTPHAFNRVIGYARYINSTTGTVLYRGQNELHSSLLPSGARRGKTAVPEEIFDDICAEQQISKFLGLDRPEIKGWKAYNYMLIEAVLQHYGANTYCMDFVDNHWCALWFGLHIFENNHYYERNDDGNLYIFLYVAETEGPCVGGMYIGNDTYTVDLRKALPSTFQRPASQHGWIVRKKERAIANLNDRVVGIIEISVKNAKKWLGNGDLLSEGNFFPSFSIDQGYDVLLSRQHRSGIYHNKKVVLPQNTICNYHVHEMFYCSALDKLYKIGKKQSIPEQVKINNMIDLFVLLLNVGWNEKTCTGNSKWSTEYPYIGQSATTSLLIQQWFGGNICSINFSSKTHYFNIIDGIVVDFTWNELNNDSSKNYYDPANYKMLRPGIGNIYHRYREKVNILIENCTKHI